MHVCHGDRAVAQVYVGHDGDVGDTTISSTTQQMIDEPSDKIVAKMRAFMHLSQQELADKIGVTRGAVSLWETGKRIPSKMAWKVLTSLWCTEASEIDKCLDGGDSDADGQDEGLGD